MATPQHSSWSDSPTDLWRKISYNYWLLALDAGYSYTSEPNSLDTQVQAMRKVTEYTAWIAANP